MVAQDFLVPEDHLLGMINHGPIEGKFSFDQKLAVMDALDALIRLKELEPAVQKLIAKMDQVHNDPAYKSLYTISMVHGCPYDGPNYGDEFQIVKDLLKVESSGETSC